MVNTNLSTTSKAADSAERRKRIYQGLLAAVLVMVATYMPDAMAQSGADGLCKFAGWLKEIATVAAIIALVLFVLNSFFIKSSVVGDIIMYVIIGCVIMVAGPYLIGLTGLTTNCSL